MSIYLLIGAVAVLWLFSLASAVIALRWTLLPGARRVGAALIAACLAVVSAYAGLARFHLDASRAVNGELQWSFHSRWFFLASLFIGLGSLVLALCHLKREGKTSGS